jgi:hypothetical protein
MVYLYIPSVIYPSAIVVYVFHFQLNTRPLNKRRSFATLPLERY